VGGMGRRAVDERTLSQRNSLQDFASPKVCITQSELSCNGENWLEFSEIIELSQSTGHGL